MLRNILTATRTHYAALQHRASSDRIPLHYTVSTPSAHLTAGTIQVKTFTKGGYQDNGKRKREMTKLVNRLTAMYPEATHIEASFN